MNLNATIFGQTISFVLFVLFCMKYVWPPLIAAIEKRQREITDNLASVAQAKKDLKIAQAEAIDKLRKANIEAQVIIEQANKHRAQLVEKAKEEAEAEHNRILALAQVKIDAERKRVREELRKQVAMLALLCAEKIIERSLDESVNSDIIDKIITDL